MTTQVFGEISWTDDTYGDKDAANKKDLFLRLADGTNEIRLLTQPYQYLVHKVKKDPENLKDFGQKVRCSKINGSCPLCDAGDSPKRRWLLGVISRVDQTYKILDISYMVFSHIQKLARNPKFGPPEKYDINIEVDRNGGATSYYTIQPYGKEPLSANDQLIKDKDLDTEDLKRRVTPPTAEWVLKQIARIRGDNAAATTAQPASTPAAKLSKPAVVNMTEEEEELDKSFPSYDDPT